MKYKEKFEELEEKISVIRVFVYNEEYSKTFGKHTLMTDKEKLQKIKRGLMQQLLTGNRRVKV